MKTLKDSFVTIILTNDGLHIAHKNELYPYPCNEIFSMPADFVLLDDTPYHYLKISFTTADSLRDPSPAWDYIGIFQDRKIALANKQRILEHYEKYKKQEYVQDDGDGRYSIMLLNSKGEEYKNGVPWLGHFERLTKIEVCTIYKND
jgi:hypothetical protein